jgi:lyso-ornithine lipid O-acyltransferase
VSDASSCLAVALPKAGRLPIHAHALLRVAAIFGSTAWTVGSMAFAPDPRFALHEWAGAVLHRLGVKIELRGKLNHWPKLWVSNHVSWLDPLVLLSLRPMGALAKMEVARYPLIGGAARKSGLAFVDREDAASRASAVVRLSTELHRGNPMLLFPEGTTTLGRGLAPLQEGGLRAAYRCGTAVQTLRLSSEDKVYPWIGDDTLMPHLLKIAQTPTTVVRLKAGEVLGPQQFHCEDEWIEAIRQQLLPAS